LLVLGGFSGCAKEEDSAFGYTCEPSVETCNLEDDDCDGLIDEDDNGLEMTRTCTNDCGEGAEICRGGDWVECSAPGPGTEVCNGKDDDCDGIADNGFDCAPGDESDCGSDVGACEFGTQTCTDTCHWGTCKGDVGPKDEDCDGVEDEDCDGTVDNGCSCDDGDTKGCCGGSTISCTNGVWPSCPAPPSETCNGLDDDCSGVADDNLPSMFLDDEDSSGIDDCGHAYTGAFLTPIYEDSPAKTYTFYLAKEDGSEDRDFFSFTTFDATDASCASNDYECFWMKVTIEEPSDTDVEMCLYEVGDVGVSTSCASYDAKACSGEGGNPANELTLPREGGCGAFDDDGRRYVLEVFRVSGTETTCDGYKFSLKLDATAPQLEPCAF
jgi:hypothetical protein